MSRGYLALVLHAHLPFVRHPEHDPFLEEDWLFEAITETYIPLILALQRLVRDGVQSRLTLSISPTLSEMLDDPLLQSRYLRYLTKRMELSEQEIVRTRDSPEFHPLAILYRHDFCQAHSLFESRYHCRLLECLRRTAATRDSRNYYLPGHSSLHAFHLGGTSSERSPGNGTDQLMNAIFTNSCAGSG